MAANDESANKGFSPEEVSRDFDEETRHKRKPAHIDRDRERDRKLILHVAQMHDAGATNVPR